MTSQIYKFLFTLLLSVCLSACNALLISKKNSPEDRDWLLSGTPLYAEGFNKLNLPEDNFMHLNEEMSRFISDQSFYYGMDKIRLDLLIPAIYYEGSLGIKFDPSITYTTEQAFLYGRANCLSFAAMVVVMARHVRFNARFNEVDVPNIWDIQDDSTLVLYKHINVVIDINYLSRQIVDISMEEYDTSYRQKIMAVPWNISLQQYVFIPNNTVSIF